MRYPAGLLLVAAAALLWSAMPVAIRSIQAADTWAVLFWRSAGMLPAVAALVLWRSGGRLAGPVLAAGTVGLIAGAGLIAAFAGSIFAVQASTVANAVFLFAAAPFLAAVLGRVILGEPVRPATWVAIAVALAGVFVMVREGLKLGMGPGTAAALVSGLGFAAFTVALRRGRLGDMFPALLVGALMSLAVGAGVTWAGGGSLAVPVRDIAVAAAAGAVLLGGGMMLYTLGSRVVPAAELTLLSMIEVMLAPVWAWALLSEAASPATLAGGAIILGAVALNALSGLAARPARV